MSAPNTPVRQIYAREKDGYVKAKSILSPAGFPVRSLVKVYPRRVIPVVFIPGIMGTNLCIKADHSPAWRPPNGKLIGVVEVLRHLNKDARKRKEILHPDRVEVDQSVPAAVDQHVGAQIVGVVGSLEEELAKVHGWGELHQESYSFILNRLQDSLHNILDAEGLPTSYWRRNVLEAQGQKEFGAEKDFKPVSLNDLKLFASAAYPVHAIGYNWLKSNNDSALRVMERLEEIIAFYRQKMDRECDKVILVTHSMGGLVGRALTKLRNSNRVLGVLHGVMPAIGAPATYKRMRAGFEGPAQVLLGRDAAETTAVLSQAPGPLELLPTKEYSIETGSSKRHWLSARFYPLPDHAPNLLAKMPASATWIPHSLAAESSRASSKEKRCEALLGVGDPYDSIYLDQASWWRLVNVDLVDPLLSDEEGKNDAMRASRNFRAFKENLDTARVFHEKLAGKYHNNTYVFYEADQKRRTWGEVCWRSWRSFRDLGKASVESDDLNGQILLRVSDGLCILRIADPDSPGDGTVPEFSGRAPKDYVTQIFRHTGEEANHVSYDHQFAYGNHFVAGLTLYSIVRLTLASKVLGA